MHGRLGGQKMQAEAVKCPHCNEPVYGVRSIDKFYRFFVHRATASQASGRAVVIGCRVEVQKAVESWSMSEFERVRAGTSEPSIFSETAGRTKHEEQS